MIKTPKQYNYNVAFIWFDTSIAIFLLLYEIINRKLRPLKELNKNYRVFKRNKRYKVRV